MPIYKVKTVIPLVLTYYVNEENKTYAEDAIAAEEVIEDDFQQFFGIESVISVEEVSEQEALDLYIRADGTIFKNPAL